MEDKMIRDMAKTTEVIPLDSNCYAKVVRTCEICGGSTSSIDNHVCENCREQIRKLFQEHRMPIEEAFIGYVEDTIDKYSTMDSIIDNNESKVHVRYIKESNKR